MKVTERDTLKHRQLRFEDYLLLPFLKENQKELVQSLRDGKYRPKPVRRVEIPKEKGKTRKLGILTVVGRLIQLQYRHVTMKCYN